MSDSKIFIVCDYQSDDMNTIVVKADSLDLVVEIGSFYFKKPILKSCVYTVIDNTKMLRIFLDAAVHQGYYDGKEVFEYKTRPEIITELISSLL